MHTNPFSATCAVPIDRNEWHVIVVWEHLVRAHGAVSDVEANVSKVQIINTAVDSGFEPGMSDGVVNKKTNCVARRWVNAIFRKKRIQSVSEKSD